MSSAISQRHAGPSAANGPWLVSGVVLGLWLVLVAYLGANGTFLVPPGEPPFALIAGVLAPLLVFGGAYRYLRSFRAYVLNADLRLVAGVQAWRFAGFGFIWLYAHGILPGFFAWPAGLGDMAIAAAAPWMVQALARRPEFAASRAFVAWNWLGIADLFVAVSAGALASGLVPGLVQGVTTAPMALLPLILVPAYLVPLMLMLHFTALLQAARSVHH